MESMFPHLQSLWVLQHKTQNHQQSLRFNKIRYDYTNWGEMGGKEELTGPWSLTKTAKFREKVTTLDGSMVEREGKI